MNAVIYQFMQRININSQMEGEYMKNGQEALKIYTKFMDTIKDEKKLKKLSIPEQTTLMENARAYEEYLQSMQQDLKYLQSSRHPLNIVNAMTLLTTSNMMLEELVRLMGGASGRIQFSDPKFLSEKGWPKITYGNQLVNLESELDAMLENVRTYLSSQFHPPPEKPLIDKAYTSMVEAQAWLLNEQDRLESEGMPKVGELTLPEIIEPKVPDQKDQPNEKD